MSHIRAQILRLLFIRRSPDLAQELPLSHDLARVAYQGRENLVLNRCEMDFSTEHKDLSPGMIHAQPAGREDQVIGPAGLFGVTARNADPGHEFANAERFGQV